MASPAEKLLVAGSDKDTRFLVRMSLRGYRVEILEVSTGPECIEKSLSTTPCLIIMNYIMDKTTGYELADRINKEIKLKNIPVIMMIPEGFDLAGEHPGVDDFLVYPFSSKQLIDTVSAVLGDRMFQLQEKESYPRKAKAAQKNKNLKKKILVADDDPDVIKLLQLILAGNYEVEIARTGRELVEKGISGEHDLIISDVIMPELSGWKSIKKLREEGVTAPVIFNSGLVKDKDLYETLKPDGPSFFFLKPFNNKELLAKISEMT